jgi:hypothetical protein
VGVDCSVAILAIARKRLQTVVSIRLAGFDIILAKMNDQPTGCRDKGKRATITSHKA